MIKVLMIITVIGLVSITVSAAIDNTKVSPAEVSDDNNCNAKAVKHLLAATDYSKKADQEWNLRTAQAYRELNDIGFTGEC